MRRLIPFLLLGFAGFALAQDGPLTNGANLPVRTDANGYLMAAAQTYTGPDGPRRVMANALLRTDANGYLIVTNPSGFGGMEIGDTVTSGTAGSVLFVGSGPVLAQDNSNFFWDDTNNRLGVRTTAPSATVHLLGSGTATGIAPSDLQGAMVSDNLQALGSGTGRAYGVIGLAKSSADADGDRVYGGYFEAHSTNFASTQIALHVSTEISTGPARLIEGYRGSTQVLALLANGKTLLGEGSTTEPTVLFHIQGAAETGTESLLLLDKGAFGKTYLAGHHTESGDGGVVVSDNTTSSLYVNIGARRGVSIGGTTSPTAGTHWQLFADGTAPSGLPTNTAGLYADDVGGTVKLHAIDEAGNVQRLVTPQTIQFAAVTFASLPTTNGAVSYCSDCTIANPCAGSGTGAIAKRLNGVHVCN